jgi:hypothetical protein
MEFLYICYTNQEAGAAAKNASIVQWRNLRVFGCPEAGARAHAWGGGGKNGHKMFASTLGKLARASVIEGREICNGWPPKAGIGEIVKFGPLFW